MNFTILPSVNAVLNTVSATFLVLGFVMIRKKRIDLHRSFMIAAFASSVLFLISYLTYHYFAGTTRFPGTGGVRALYFAILISHTILAAIVPPLAILTLVRGLRGTFETHRRIARWALPIWLYVSITGVVVYWMLYRIQWNVTPP